MISFHYSFALFLLFLIMQEKTLSFYLVSLSCKSLFSFLPSLPLSSQYHQKATHSFPLKKKDSQRLLASYFVYPVCWNIDINVLYFLPEIGRASCRERV